jgi:uncharacterized surface protein with fasciclin (FAS1) repeats
MIKKLLTFTLTSTLLLAPTLSAAADGEYNNFNRFIRWRADNEYVLSVQNAKPFYGAKVLLETKNDSNRNAQRWDYDKITGQIKGMNDFCLGVGGQYELMLKNCVETTTHTLWNFDEKGRLVGSINVTGVREAFCIDGKKVEKNVEMKYVKCEDKDTQKYELEGVAKTALYNDILLFNDGQKQDTLFNTISNSQDLETLRDIIQIIGSEQTLRNEKLTVFAPTDEAFEKVDKAILKKLMLPENKELLKELVSYHVTPTISAETLISQAGVVNIKGDHIQLINGKLNNQATITQKNIPSRNGLVHKIDSLLVTDSFLQKIK